MEIAPWVVGVEFSPDGINYMIERGMAALA